MTETSELQQWLNLAERMKDTGFELAAASEASSDHGAEIAALALLSRSINHLQAVLLLAKADLLVEARVVVRCLFDNYFLAASIKDQPHQSYKNLIDDLNASRGKRGKLITENSKLFSEAQRADVRSVVEGIPKGTFANPKKLAALGGTLQYYHFHAQLSADSAHPSFEALERHIIRDSEGKITEISVPPKPERDEMSNTVGWACLAFGEILPAVQSVVAGGGASEKIDAVRAENIRLIDKLLPQRRR